MSTAPDRSLVTSPEAASGRGSDRYGAGKGSAVTEQVGDGALHHAVSREQFPGDGPCGHTSVRVACSCGRSIRSIFPWVIDHWMIDHDFMVTGVTR